MNQGVAAAVQPFLKLAAGTAGVHAAWSPALGFRVLCGREPLPAGTNLKDALCAQVEARCGDVEHSMWQVGAALLGSLSLLNAGCSVHANCAFVRASGSDAVRVQVTKAISSGAELLAPYKCGAGSRCAFPGCTTKLVWGSAQAAGKCS